MNSIAKINSSFHITTNKRINSDKNEISFKRTINSDILKHVPVPDQSKKTDISLIGNFIGKIKSLFAKSDSNSTKSISFIYDQIENIKRNGEIEKAEGLLGTLYVNFIQNKLDKDLKIADLIDAFVYTLKETIREGKPEDPINVTRTKLIELLNENKKNLKDYEGFDKKIIDNKRSKSFLKFVEEKIGADVTPVYNTLKISTSTIIEYNNTVITSLISDLEKHKKVLIE